MSPTFIQGLAPTAGCQCGNRLATVPGAWVVADTVAGLNLLHIQHLRRPIYTPSTFARNHSNLTTALINISISLDPSGTAHLSSAHTPFNTLSLNLNLLHANKFSKLAINSLEDNLSNNSVWLNDPYT